MKQKPMENAIWWLEYLSSTKGAEHLKLSSRHLNFFQYYSLDCLVFMVVTIGLCLKVFCFMLFRQRKQTKKSKKD
jgi:tellurite resistance protein TehA-like permease